MRATYWEVLARTGFESRWGRISVAASVASLCLFTSLPGDRHNLPLAWHAARDMSAIGWGNDCTQFKLSHMLMASIVEGDSMIHATLLTLAFISWKFTV